MAELEIGCSGFNYRHWRGNFYPQELSQKKWLAHYCSVFSSVELNVTFYRLPKGETFEKWQDETPQSFCFAVKGSRFITHVKRLLDPEEALQRFFDQALHMEKKLKVVLWQFPPSFSINMDRMRIFVGFLGKYPVRNTFEFRNESWITPELVELCRRHNISLCMADWPEFLNSPPATADFIYIRRHGHDEKHTGCYSQKELKEDARRISRFLADGRDVFIYFNNDVQGFAPRNAQDLMKMLKVTPAPRVRRPAWYERSLSR